jgi:hypothetical protein
MIVKSFNSPGLPDTVLTSSHGQFLQGEGLKISGIGNKRRFFLIL